MVHKEAFLARSTRKQRSHIKLEEKHAERKEVNLRDKVLCFFSSFCNSFKAKHGRRGSTEEEKARKELERQQDRAQRKLLKVQSKDQKKLSKQQAKREDKERSHHRKEILVEMRRNRVEALAAVLQQLDEEESETMPSSQQAPFSTDTKELLSSLIDSLQECVLLDGSARWEDLISVSMTLLLFSDVLKVNVATDVDHIATLLHESCGLGLENSTITEAEVDQSTLETLDKTSDSSNWQISHEKKDRDEEEEWDESAAFKSTETQVLHERAKVKENRQHLAKAYLERILLSLLRLLSDDLNSILETTEKGDKATRVLLPLNHLTWPEHMRMILIARIALSFNEMWNPKPEEVLFIVKGNRGIGFRSNKSMNRNIRYRFVANATKDSDKGMEPFAPAFNMNVLPIPLNVNDFYTDSELETGLEALAKDLEYSNEYRRCAKVLIKIIKTTASKHMIWEIDSNSYPYYYTIIKRPIMLCNIATNLVNRSYGEENVSLCFYRDVSLAAVNCFAFYSETSGISAQAIKVLHTLRRHMIEWVWKPDAPDIDLCSDTVCIVSNAPLQLSPPSFIKCSKCMAAFNLITLDTMQHFANISPTREILTNHQEEWCCHFCIQEDSTWRCYTDNIPFDSPPFLFNEWGLSGSVPWFLNEDIVFRTVEFMEDEENRIRLEALRIVCSPDRLVAFTMSDKLIVLRALCELLRYNSKCCEYITRLHADCSKLLKLVAKETVREAELLELIRAIVGDRANGVLRSFFEGLDESSEDMLRNRVIEGRCVICRGSTYEGDLDDDEEVVLCDGCNGEAHLRCLNLTEVIAHPHVGYYLK